MGSITLTDEARQCLALFEDVTETSARDCVVDEEFDRVVVLVEPGQMGKAIGSRGQNVEKVERKLSQTVKLVEAADDVETFVANALAPAAVYNVTISEGDEDDDVVAYVEVAEEDRGAAIGKDGRTIRMARTLAERHFDVDEIQLV